MSKAFDIIVIGLGAMGSASVYQLARKGVRVLGIDQFDPPHRLGSSHGDSRIIRQANGEGEAYVPLVRRAYELWRDIENESGKKLLEITEGLIMAGDVGDSLVHGAFGFLDRTIACATKFAVPHSLLNAEQIRASFPQFNLTGDERGYYEPSIGFLRPELCIQAQLDLAKAHGAQIKTNTRVLNISSSSQGVRVTTSAGEYSAGKIVVSAGPWITRFVETSLADRFKIYRQVVFWFEPKDAIEAYRPDRFPIFIWVFDRNLDDFFYGLPVIDGTSGIKFASEQHEVSDDPETVSREVSEQEIDVMYEHCVRPRLPGVSRKCLKTTVCLYTSTPDSHFVLGFAPSDRNIVIVSPCSGHGFKHSAAIGEIASELVVNGRSRIDISQFGLDRFR